MIKSTFYDAGRANDYYGKDDTPKDVYVPIHRLGCLIKSYVTVI